MKKNNQTLWNPALPILPKIVNMGNWKNAGTSFSYFFVRERKKAQTTPTISGCVKSTWYVFTLHSIGNAGRYTKNIKGIEISVLMIGTDLMKNNLHWSTVMRINELKTTQNENFQAEYIAWYGQVGEIR